MGFWGFGDSEIAQLSGISNTDWSWAPLFADYDNDGWKDLFVTNGYTRDFTNLDFLKFMNDFIASKGRLKREEIMEMLKQMPASNVINYLYKNNGDLTFKDVSKQWGINTPSNSNGAAYVDLDNDGDLDLVVSNTNISASVYRNESNKQTQNHYLNIQLKGESKNTDGIGAKLMLYSKGQLQYLEQMPARGFQSTVTSVLHFGLGKETAADSLKITWNSGKVQMLDKVKSDQLLILEEKNAAIKSIHTIPVRSIYEEITAPLNYTNAVNPVNDFKRQPLMVNPFSFAGPCIIKADVNKDELEDIFAGGGSGVAGAIYLQQKNGQFVQQSQQWLNADKLCKDADAVFTDVNNDGFPDLYVASGGYHNYQPNDSMLQDRLYLNDGKGNFTKLVGALPAMRSSKSCVRAADINGDGFMDLFVGGRVIPGEYPETPQSFLLQNDGKGKFTDVTATLAPALQKIGMVTDAAWLDINNDKKPDLVVTGEWMPVTVFVNANGKLQDQTDQYFSKRYSGWWNKLLVTDLNGDGKQDLVVGNNGLNSQCRATDKEPAEMFYKDFDNNGSIDPILCLYLQHKTFPYVTRDELLDQMSIMRTRFPDYKGYADAGLKDIFTPEELKDAKRLEANCLATTYFEMSADGKFKEKPLPLQAQFSPVFSITPVDYNKDGKTDLLLCGNSSHARLRFGKSDANYGVLLQNDGQGNFSYISQPRSGFRIKGDVRCVVPINDLLLFGINQQQAKAYRLKK